MDHHEYQAKELLKRYNVPVQEGIPVDTPQAAEEAYKNLKVSSAASTNQSGAVTVSFDVTNTGKRAGAEVAQVYVGDQHSGVPRPPKELKGFAKIFLNAGETKRVAIGLDQRAFSYYDVAGHQWKLTPGDFDIYVGPSSGEIALTGKTTLATAIASRSGSKF